jgi:hypothetical protein
MPPSNRGGIRKVQINTILFSITLFRSLCLSVIWGLILSSCLLQLCAQIPSFQSTLTVSSPVCPGANTFAAVQGISISSLERGPGLGCINHTSPLGSNADSWASGATLNLNDNDYFEFRVSGAGCPFRLDSLRLWLRKSPNFPPQRLGFYYVINNGTPQPVNASIDISGYANGSLFRLAIDFSAIPSLTAGDQIAIRMYGWQSTSSGGTLRWVSQPGNETILYGSFPNLSAGSVSADQTICPGNSGTLNLTGYNGLIQRWEYANPPYAGWNVIGNTTASQAYSGLTQDTRYRAVVSCGTHLDTSQVAQLTWGLASAVMSGDHTICSGPPADITVQLNGLPPWDMTWSDGTAQYTQYGISSSPWIITVNPVQSTTYTLMQVMNTCGAASPLSGSARITKGYTHFAILSGGQDLCGTSGTGMLNFQFSGLPPWNIQYTDGSSLYSIPNISTTIHQVPVTINSNTTYSFVSSYSGICPGSASGSAIFTLRPIPTAQVSGPAVLCRPNVLQLSFQLTGSPPWQIDWTDGTVQYFMNSIMSTPVVMNVANPSSGLYSILSVQDSFCSGVGGASTSLLVADPPTASISGSATLCNGQSGQLSVNLSGVPPWDITWTDGTVNNTITGITQANYILSVSPQVYTTWQLVAVNDNQCGSGSVSGMGEVFVLQPPTADLTGDTAFCEGGNGQLQMDLTGESPWSFIVMENGIPQVFSGVVQSPWVLPVAPLNTTQYILTQVSNICEALGLNDSVLVKINEVPDWNYQGPDWLCRGEIAENTLNFSGPSPWKFYFSKNGEVDSIIGITQSPYAWVFDPGDSLLVLGLGGVSNPDCKNSREDTVEIPIYPKPEPVITARDSDLVFWFGHGPSAYDSLVWSFGDQFESRDSFPIHEYADYVSYPVGLLMHLGMCSARRDTIVMPIKPYLDYVVIYENPNDGDFTFSVNYLSAGDVANIAWINSEGRILFEEDAISPGRKIVREVKLKGQISPGNYFLRVINKHGIFRVKIIIK